MRVPRSPYLTPAGPDARERSRRRRSRSRPATAAVVTATLDDTRYLDRRRRRADPADRRRRALRRHAALGTGGTPVAMTRRRRRLRLDRRGGHRRPSTPARSTPAGTALRARPRRRRATGVPVAGRLPHGPRPGDGPASSRARSRDGRQLVRRWRRRSRSAVLRRPRPPAPAPIRSRCPRAPTTSPPAAPGHATATAAGVAARARYETVIREFRARRPTRGARRHGRKRQPRLDGTVAPGRSPRRSPTARPTPGPTARPAATATTSTPP